MDRTVHSEDAWKVKHGQLVRKRGRPGKDQPLFKVVGEKLPFEALSHVRQDLRNHHPSIGLNGIYMAHDSMGQVRYVGRGQVFARLRARQKAQRLELAYFSFYIGMNKRHEGEIETLLIRAVGAMAYFNRRMKREDIGTGRVEVYEPGTIVYERRYTRTGRSIRKGARNS
jgi:hypothetical protein